MALIVDKIKTISDKIKYLVNGYMRRCQKLFHSNDNPYYNLHGHNIIIVWLLLFCDDPEVFDVNDKEVFDYKFVEHGSLFHIFTNKLIERHIFQKYQWEIETSKTFSGRIGIIDHAKVDKV